MAESTLTITEAATHLNEVVDRARRLHESTLLTENGEPVARVVPVAFESGHTVGELLAWLPTREKLDAEETAAFAADVEEFRRQCNKPPVWRWD